MTPKSNFPKDFVPNSFQVPNIIVDEYMCKLSANAFKVYMVMVRKTKGWNKSSDSLSQGQIMSLTGINSHNTARKAINELIGFDLIHEEKSKKGKQSTFFVALHSEKLTESQPSQKLTTSIIDHVPSQDLTGFLSKTDEPPSQKLTIQNTEIEILNTLSLSAGARITPSSAVVINANKPDDVDQELWDEWIAIRLAKDSTMLTKRYLASMAKEAALVGLTLAEAIEFCCDRSWQGFKAAWYTSAQTAYVEKPTAPSVQIESLVATKPASRNAKTYSPLPSNQTSKTANALASLAKHEPKNWIEKLVRDNLQAFFTAGFKATPASELWLKTISDWAVILEKRNFDESIDAKRMSKSFELMYSRIESFPTLKDFFDYLPERSIVPTARRVVQNVSDNDKALANAAKAQALTMVGSKRIYC